MSDRKQARAMDLPDFPCPPSVGEIATHAGSWGWINPGHVSQDERGYLWVKRNAVPSPAARSPQDLQALAAWSEGGIALYVSRRGYQHIDLLRGDVDESAWAPVASVMKEIPGYASFEQ
ncbi:hypothetical protein EES43_24815 [Streptomyces sp. ADI96-02]|uniref:hypothetical protein n=1 Tax=Streptomyces sp. ADI96-02 TaxID=1522760 RepID=UPI000F5551BA|nr:hypothetical protein [Streptomyces sp. ADI96-02]RPK56269.1 hypothetical protein EES43_24815 [Streptomyces sp. ADI96-02]